MILYILKNSYAINLRRKPHNLIDDEPIFVYAMV